MVDSEELHKLLTLSKLRIQREDTLSKFKTIEVLHWHFQGWADDRYPDSKSEVDAFKILTKELVDSLIKKEYFSD